MNTQHKRNAAIGSIPIFMAFLAMGFGDVAGPLTDLVRKEYELSYFMARFIPFAGFLMFGLLSVPFSLVQARSSKKTVLSLGLFVALAGLLIPLVFSFDSFPLLLSAILLLGAGAALLQVAGNPIMRDVSPEGKYSRNLSMGQFVKAIGSLSGALLPAAAAIWWGLDWKILFPVYSIILAITIIVLLLIPIKEQKTTKDPPSISSCFKVLTDPFALLMVIGIFLYVGAEVCMSSGLPGYLSNNHGVDIEKYGVAGTGLFFLSLMIGRFLGGVILNWGKAPLFLIITSILSLGGIALLFTGNQAIAISAIVIIGLGFANIFPLIFSITLDRIPNKANELSGLMVTAIVGGAILPLLMGKIADLSSLMLGFLVPAASVLYVLFTALKTFHK